MPPMRKVKKDWQTGLIGVGKGCYGYIQTGGLNISNAGLVVGTDSCLVIDTLPALSLTHCMSNPWPKRSSVQFAG